MLTRRPHNPNGVPILTPVIAALALAFMAACGDQATSPADQRVASVADSSGSAIDSAADSAAHLTTTVRVPARSSVDDVSADSLALALAALREAIVRLEGRVEVLAAENSSSSSLPEGIQARSAGDAPPPGTLRGAARGEGGFLLKILWTLIVVAATALFLRFCAWLLDTLAERRSSRRLFFKRLIPIVRVLTWATILYYVVGGVFGVDRRGLLAASAAVGVAIGFAAQDLLKNVFGGVLILLDQPFQVGDRISIGGTYGEVVSIGLRSTRIVTPDDSLVTVPNAQVVDGQVSNANAGALDCQVVTTLYVSGDADIARAKKVAYDAAVNSKYVFLKKPVVVLVVDEFEHSFVTKVIVKAYVYDARYEALLASDITEEARRQFRDEGWLPREERWRSETPTAEVT